MTPEEARHVVGTEMDYWRTYIFDKMKEKGSDRSFLLEDEIIVCAILGAASALLQRPL